MRGQYLGSGGVPLVHLPRVLSDEFGITVSEARRVLAAGQVELDGEVTHRVDMPVAELAGRELRIGRESVEVRG